ncbi:chaperonin 10-like protein [Apodospora peruviana]|uniref:Chaperonin 10-like protein n=1 Tax=Apodospora peruviana TaxID=516989 RepID=A0AAE0HUP3_9PEZI|nr:chaperonin 10-like protein [Apodospora peruviana]
MKEALVAKDLTVQIIDSPIPEPNDDQVLIKVVVSGSNPKDWKYPALRGGEPSNAGDDIAGYVEKVGLKVFEFKPGDRVAAFHEMMTAHGSYAEYAIAWQHTTFHIPQETSFEEAATLPLAAMTAAVGLYQRLGLPEPWSPLTNRNIPLVIYGASSAVGFYALQFAIRSEIHPIICVAGRAKDYVEPYLDATKGDVVVDYRDGDDTVVQGILKAGQNAPLLHVFDAVSENGSPANIGRVFASNPKSDEVPKVTFVLGGPKECVTPRGEEDKVEQSITMVGSVHKEAKDFGYVFYRYIARGLQEGWFKGHRPEVVPGGLGGVQTALGNLKAGKASAVKYVFRIGETEGVQQG